MSISTATLILEQLDARHKGHRLFTHRVNIRGTKVERFAKFHELRTACWEVWGPSDERDIMLSFWRDQYKSFRNEHWCWHYDAKMDDVYIYLSGIEEVSFFKLKWM